MPGRQQLKIWEDTDGQVDIMVAGVGTGGTITGVAGNQTTEARVSSVAVEPANSPVLAGDVQYTKSGHAGFIPKSSS